LIGSFNRCDHGDAYVDHHVFFCLNHPKTGLNHLSFEVPDIDDVWWVRRARDAGIEFVVVSPNSNDARISSLRSGCRSDRTPTPR